MANYAKQFLEELKVKIQEHLNTLTTNQDHIAKLMKAFEIPADPTPKDVDQVIYGHSEYLQTQMIEILSNNDSQQDSQARLDQADLFAKANVSISPMMTQERSNFIDHQFNALAEIARGLGAERSVIAKLSISISQSNNNFGKFQAAMDTLEDLVNSKKAIVNPDIHAAIAPIPSAKADQAAKAVDQYVAPTLDAKATTAKEKLVTLISNGTLNDSAQKELKELKTKLDTGVSDLSAAEAQQLKSAIVQTKNSLLGLPLPESNQAIIDTVSALAQLQLAMNKQYPQVENAVIESKNPDGKISTPDDFVKLMQEAGKAGKVKFDKMEGNVALFAENSENIKYEIKVTSDHKNPNNFVVEGTDIQKVADLVRGIHEVDKSIPLTLKMGNDPEKAFELLDKLNYSENNRDSERVKVNVTPEQRATFEKAFAKDPAKLASLKEILSTQDRLAAQSPEPEAEAHSAPKGP